MRRMLKKFCLFTGIVLFATIVWAHYSSDRFINQYVLFRLESNNKVPKLYKCAFIQEIGGDCGVRPLYTPEHGDWACLSDSTMHAPFFYSAYGTRCDGDIGYTFSDKMYFVVTPWRAYHYDHIRCKTLE